MKTDTATVMAEMAVLGMREVFISGPITSGDADRFVQFAESHKLEAARIVLDSPGGSLLEGIKLGRAIREKRFFTSVGAFDDQGTSSNAICASACAYAFAGGVSRFLDRSSGRLGIHQFERSGGLSQSEAQLISAIVVSYLRDMGVDAKAFVIASATSASGIRWLTPSEAQELGLVNNGVQPTSAEVRIVRLHPYLRLNQDKSSGTIRALFTCGKGTLLLQAGIVTDPEQSALFGDARWQKRSYLEIDGRETAVVNGPAGAKPEDSAVWLFRVLDSKQAADLLKASELGVWIDGFGAVRAGGSMDLKPVRSEIADYFKQCLSSYVRR
ncbi:hypothetical protein [Sphingomonas sediminicola]|uniref:COG3904 family protein n=2 Tax=Sphingomonas TaxID=13687 RepID=UPI0013B468A2|nr:hypothetical protein ['Sphingomonas ginsengisoli' Hoang et al. 2012]